MIISAVERDAHSLSPCSADGPLRPYDNNPFLLHHPFLVRRAILYTTSSTQCSIAHQTPTSSKTSGCFCVILVEVTMQVQSLEIGCSCLPDW